MKKTKNIKRIIIALGITALATIPQTTFASQTTDNECARSSVLQCMTSEKTQASSDTQPKTNEDRELPPEPPKDENGRPLPPPDGFKHGQEMRQGKEEARIEKQERYEKVSQRQ